MFFVLYALALLVLFAGWALGIGLLEGVLIYGVLAVLLAMWISAARAKRQASMPRNERRKPSLRVQVTH